MLGGIDGQHYSIIEKVGDEGHKVGNKLAIMDKNFFIKLSFLCFLYDLFGETLQELIPNIRQSVLRRRNDFAILRGKKILPVRRD